MQTYAPMDEDMDDEAVEPSERDPMILTEDEYRDIIDEVENQPVWRATADKEMDYADGNQLDSELLARQKALGIPPAVEDLIGPALLSIRGYESTTRTDWRVTPDGDIGGQDVADALNYKLNQAERHSKADRACSDAFRTQIAVGIGWVEVKRESDPTKYPYRCIAVHRNEIHWDMTAEEPDLSDARWLRRQRWVRPNVLAMMFPAHRELIERIGRSGPGWHDSYLGAVEGGTSTGLNKAWAVQRASTIAEDRWYNPTAKKVCIAEVWYRRWVQVGFVTAPNGRVVEYDEANLAHQIALASGASQFKKAIVSRIRRSYWLGPHRLGDDPTPYPHNHYPYVPFWGFTEDGTGVPFGYVRGMIFPQDSLNSAISKLRWGMSAVRVERTKGAIAMTDAQLRTQVSRIDADIVLDPDAMARTGARFEVKRDFALNNQHFQMMQDSRSAIQRVSTVTAGFMGQEGTATSGRQEQIQVEQSNQSLGVIMDNFRAARSQVGELLLALLIEDMGSEQQTVIIEGDAVREDRTVVINRPEVDPDTGVPYLSNDLQRTRLKVALEDVPSTNSYRGQQLNALSEAVKSLPAQYQAAVLPYMVSLMDVPFKQDLIESIRNASAQDSPEQVEARIKQAVADALAKAGAENKGRELDIKERLTDAQIKKIITEQVQVGVQTAYSAMQAGAQVAQMPMIAPIADAVMQGAGWQRPNPAGQDPNFPQPGMQAGMDVGSPYSQPPGMRPRTNTSPAYPPVPQDGGSPMQGIETPTPADNL